MTTKLLFITNSMASVIYNLIVMLVMMSMTKMSIQCFRTGRTGLSHGAFSSVSRSLMAKRRKCEKGLLQSLI